MARLLNCHNPSCQCNCIKPFTNYRTLLQMINLYFKSTVESNCHCCRIIGGGECFLKVLDVHPLKNRLHRNITMLDRLGNEMETIDRAVQGLVAMEDSLKGEGGNAIRTFYADCHLPFLQFFKL